ncbi:MAG TPA: hypothetical protein VJ912_03965 [Candidatus Nanoarchaeia archaeon]|nr:hypothetical protein [Candidatus Nanoarchaeia archaeon]
MKISKEKKNKILEQILLYLYTTTPNPVFTSNIAEEIARDEEFVKKLLLELKHKGLVNEIKKSPKGVNYLRRSRWKLSNKAYEVYNKKQI